MCAVQVEQGMLGMQGGYVTYRVSASTALPGYSAPNVPVRRRFRDFVVRISLPLGGDAQSPSATARLFLMLRHVAVAFAGLLRCHRTAAWYNCGSFESRTTRQLQVPRSSGKV